MAEKIYIVRTSVMVNGEQRHKENVCIPFAFYEHAMKVLETIEDSYYYLVTNNNWDCSEDREYNKTNEPLFWFKLVGKNPKTDFIEGWIEDREIITDVKNYEVKLTYTLTKEVTQTINVSAYNPTLAYAYAEKVLYEKTKNTCDKNTQIELSKREIKQTIS